MPLKLLCCSAVGKGYVNENIPCSSRRRTISGVANPSSTYLALTPYEFQSELEADEFTKYPRAQPVHTNHSLLDVHKEAHSAVWILFSSSYGFFSSFWKIKVEKVQNSDLLSNSLSRCLSGISCVITRLRVTFTCLNSNSFHWYL